ncbi:MULTISPECIES: hypothetical protein [unclassified Clostridium]|jgi:hypothetical protein|uniref:hypothetical protein n=1 Tax=unclassified Clostridium TaxID=2614128 RepID=UPI0025B91AD8|nr:hypothetical protein [Clostridium sp.]MCI6692107.1 hypothetical protein [Clostridium sp.]MDY2631360.1 hypothetical protein [Clostridium sp.]MDY4253054.1 hypothetical protein [Clostridium sp.]
MKDIIERKVEMDINIFAIILILLVIFMIFNIVYYIPNKLKEQEEKQALYIKELYIRLNRLESKIDEIINIESKR